MENEVLKDIISWLVNNKEWLFSGLGVVLLSCFVKKFCFKKHPTSIHEQNVSENGTVVQTGGGAIPIDNAKMLTAIHEAGHAVILYHFGFRADEMGLFFAKGHWNGYTKRNFSKISLFDQFVDDFYNPPIDRPQLMAVLSQKYDRYLQQGGLPIQNFIRDFVMFVAAGEEAERIFVDRFPAVIRDDNVGPDGITRIFFCGICNGLSQYVETHLRNLLSCYEMVIEDLAKALYNKGCLNQYEIEDELKYRCNVSQVESFMVSLKQKSLSELKNLLPTYEIRKKMAEWILNTTGKGYLVWLDSVLEYKSIENEINQKNESQRR